MSGLASNYNRVYFSIVITALFSVLVVNFAVDPLGRFRIPEKIYFSIERELKPKLLALDHYEGVLLGSSKVTYIQPEGLGVNGKVLNAAFSGAVPEEIYYFLRDYEPDVKWLAIGLDFYMFNENSFPWKQDMSSAAVVSDFSYLVSVDTLEYTIRAIRNRQQSRHVKYTRSGAENAVYREKMDNGPCCDYLKDLALLKKLHFNNFLVSDKRLDILRKIQLWADERNVSIFVWINPYNHAVYDLAENMIPGEMNLLRHEISNVFSHSIDLSMAYPGAGYYWKNDPYHFYPSTAELMFRQNFTDEINRRFPK